MRGDLQEKGIVGEITEIRTEREGGQDQGKIEGDIMIGIENILEREGMIKIDIQLKSTREIGVIVIHVKEEEDD